MNLRKNSTIVAPGFKAGEDSQTKLRKVASLKELMQHSYNNEINTEKLLPAIENNKLRIGQRLKCDYNVTESPSELSIVQGAGGDRFPRNIRDSAKVKSNTSVSNFDKSVEKLSTSRMGQMHSMPESIHRSLQFVKAQTSSHEESIIGMSSDKPLDLLISPEREVSLDSLNNIDL